MSEEKKDSQPDVVYDAVLSATAFMYRHELEKIKSLPTYQERVDAIQNWAGAKALQLRATLQIGILEELGIPDFLPEEEKLIIE